MRYEPWFDALLHNTLLLAQGGLVTGLFWLVICVLAGWLQAAALAWPVRGWSPPGLSPGEPSGWLQIGSLSLLVLALLHVHQARQGVWRAWVFATAWLASTFWWLFVSMHTYGGLPAWLAALAVLALAGLLALYYALAAGLMCALAPRSRIQQAVMFAALWTLAELARGRWLTGFPWGAGGYAQVDLMAAWAPWVGVYGMGAIAALLAFALAAALSALYLQTLSAAVILFGYHALWTPITIDQPVGVAATYLLSWSSGIGIGLIFKAATPWAPDFFTVATTAYTRANMVFSGKMFVANNTPNHILQWFDWNPLFHTIDQGRGFIFLNYNPHNSSLSYPVYVAAATIVLGLMGEFFTRKHISASWSARG